MLRILSVVACIFVICFGMPRQSLQASASIASQEPMGIPTDTQNNVAPDDDDDNKTKDGQQSKLEAKIYNFKKEMQKSPWKFGPSYDNKGAQIRLETSF